MLQLARSLAVTSFFGVPCYWFATGATGTTARKEFNYDVIFLQYLATQVISHQAITGEQGQKFCKTLPALFERRDSVWQNLAFEDRIRMASQGDFRSSEALLTNQELRLKHQRQQIVEVYVLFLHDPV